MDNLVFGILLAYAFLLGLKLIRPNAAGAGDLRAAGAILAFAMVPAVALERFRPGALGSVKLFEADLDVLAALTALFGTLLAIELLLGFGSFVRVRSKGEDYLRIHRALFRIGLLLIVFPIVLKVRFGDALDFTRVLQSAAVGSIILGLALQNTLSNLFAGLGIEAENMLRQGDFVKIGLDGPRGIVIDKTWRSTRILTNDGETVFVPNNEIGNILLINYDRPTRVVALRAEVGVAYDAPPLVVKETIENECRRRSQDRHRKRCEGQINAGVFPKVSRKPIHAAGKPESGDCRDERSEIDSCANRAKSCRGHIVKLFLGVD